MFKMKYSITQKYLTNKTQRRSGILMPYVGFIVSHDTGNDGSTASDNVNYYESSKNEVQASAHTFIDDKDIIECIPATQDKPEKAWHVLYNRSEDNEKFGDNSNDIGIGVELCYSEEKGSINNTEAYKRYVWYHAYLCYKFGLDPRSKIVGHNELDPDRKTDPFMNAMKLMGISKDRFIYDVVRELDECTKVKEEDESMTKEEKQEFDELKAVVESQGKLIRLLQGNNKMKEILTWVKDAVNAAVKAELIDTPEDGSYDFYRMVTLLWRKGIV
ncbi:N-acetylmuramoyl-L-alanine amidase [Paenibacillus nanensis]|uniref:N-acetylmuramoyl-L-alanine amidase n=1 Tax=Paenibacillus nanensis TaxID=393251 RepID=A0A3A1VEE1_9BACL|nr:peptidoglycan recognition family protein [Paenibacillus nanensis]RIX59278.1 N-acetylmuramoyl-L-alanine amidase [Paenibacillus nanensis]